MRVFFQDKDAMQNHPPNNNIIHNTQVTVVILIPGKFTKTMRKDLQGVN